jgi:hypothetical protein
VGAHDLVTAAWQLVASGLASMRDRVRLVLIFNRREQQMSVENVWQHRLRAWQSAGIARRDPSRCQQHPNRRLALHVTKIDDQLAEIRHRIDRIQAGVQTGANGALPRIQRHLDAVHEAEASVRAATRQAPDEVEEKLGELKARLDVAEHSLAADLSDDWATFAAAVEEELRSWDTYLERLQTSAATKAWKTRQESEAAIRDVRSRRIAVEQRLAQACDGSGDAGDKQRERVTAARDELAQTADQLSTKFN